MADGSRVNTGLGRSDDAGAPFVEWAALPAPCAQFLAQLQCWLRASGNDTTEVDRAVGDARALFEARSDAAESC